jgi:alpha-tubulin suppressor-like RCC1 family protein
MPYEPTTNFKDSNNVDLGKKLVTKDYLLSVYETILENSPASGLVVTPELWGWGLGTSGQLGNNAATNRSTPVTTFAGGTNWKQVSNGENHTAAIKTDGTLWTWGSNQYGQLGNNQGNVNRSTPVTTFAGGNDWKSVACGRFHTLAIKTDGSLWTWGENGQGHLGDFSTTSRSTPVTTFAGGNNWKQVAGGQAHTAAIKTDGSLWTWGWNNSGTGQLGNNPANALDNARSTPITTFAGGNNWKQVSCGNIHTVAIKTDGSLWVFGSNDNGQLGINQGNVKRGTPVTTFAGGNDWKSVASGSAHTVAIKTDGTLWVWGLGTSGQLGNNAATNRSTPVTTFAGGTNWKSVSGGDGHTAAIKTDGSLWVWGLNTSAQLGTNDGGNRSTPVTTFAGGNDWKQVSGGTAHTVAIKSIDYI